jgi:DNA-binding NarL/FixJ family response regulator
MPNTPKSRISVLLAHPEPIFCQGLRALLADYEDLNVVAAVGTGREALKEAQGLRPDVVVMDTALPGLSGIEAARGLRQLQPGASVVFLSAQRHASVVHEALEAGARGYLTKEADDEELVKAIRIVAAGKRYFSKVIADKVFEGLEVGGRPDAALLTACEREIVRLVTAGSSNAEAAQQVKLSPRTVETYRIRIMRKLGCDNLPELVKFAIREGLTTLD